MPHIFCIKHENVARCLFESATPFRLEIVQITSEGVSRLGASVFAPVGRGTADHPDRDRQRDEHTADRRPDRQTRLHGQPRNQTQHMVPVQRERILPRTNPTGRTGRSVSRRGRGPAGATSPAPRTGRPDAAAPGPASRTTTAPSSPATRNCANGSAWPPTSPPRTRRAGAAATRTATARSAATCPSARASTRPWPTRYRPSWTRPTTVPCACSATPRPRHSPTNYYH